MQTRLFPQTAARLKTLDYAGICLQAREVGGDYYDFLSLGRERLGLVIGDISGKGIAAALLMANLQAGQLNRAVPVARELFSDEILNLRSLRGPPSTFPRSALAREQCVQVLRRRVRQSDLG